MTVSRRRVLQTLAAASVLSSRPLSATESWSVAEPMPLNTQELYPAVHQGRLYVAGGIAAKLGVPYFTERCVSFDPTVNRWRDEPDLPEPLHHAALVSTGERLFCVGGFNGGLSHIWRMRMNVYELCDQQWRLVGTLPKPQAEGVLASAPNGIVHLVTGQSPRDNRNNKRSDHSEVNTHLGWQPGSETWEELPDIPTARNSATGGWIGDQLIVTGGRTSRGNLNHTEIYDSISRQWRSAAPMPKPQAGTASVVVSDGLVVFGGEIFTPRADVFADVWLYSMSQDTWTALPKLRTPRHGLGAGRFGDQAFVVGGATRPGGRGTSAVNEVLNLSAFVSN